MTNERPSRSRSGVCEVQAALGGELTTVGQSNVSVRNLPFTPSSETERKEQDFAGLLRWHTDVCRGIRERFPLVAPYLYVDLHAGPGELEYRGRRFDGSPLVARARLDESGIPYRALHFERDRDTAAVLRSALQSRGYPTLGVLEADHAEGVPTWLGRQARDPYQFGLVYSDPIRDPIPVDTFNQLAAHFQRVDLLAYVAANDQYKRANGAGAGHGRSLAQDIAAVHKRVVLIREGSTAHQWTFVLWTNWANIKQWEGRGFYRLDTNRGRQILRRLNLTAAEIRALDAQKQGAFREPSAAGAAPYKSYREYLQHPRFKAIRAEAFARTRGRCSRCSARATEPHHLIYPPWGTFDVPENLLPVCHQCHSAIHGKAD